MAIIVKESYQREFPVVVDLTGPDGDPIVLCQLVKYWGWKTGLDDNSITDILKDLISSDGYHLMDVIESNFGDHVTLLTHDPATLM